MAASERPNTSVDSIFQDIGFILIVVLGFVAFCQCGQRAMDWFDARARRRIFWPTENSERRK